MHQIPLPFLPSLPLPRFAPFPAPVSCTWPRLPAPVLALSLLMLLQCAANKCHGFALCMSCSITYILLSIIVFVLYSLNRWVRRRRCRIHNLMRELWIMIYKKSIKKVIIWLFFSLTNKGPNRWINPSHVSHLESSSLPMFQKKCIRMIPIKTY